jgi:capsid protein
MAYLVYGSRYRLDNVRGLPLISSVLETLRKLDRYKEAAVGGAEERQKIAYTIEHNADSTGEDPTLAKMAQSSALGMGEAPESKSTDEYEAAATKVATMTQKSTINMPIGAALKMHASAMESGFKDFYTTNIQFVTAAMNIPYEVALSMYNSNYSASRAAIKEWEHSMKFKRQVFAEQYYQPFYNLWLEMAILSGKINAPGYIKAINDKNIMAIGAYSSAKWMGANVPHIDPVKEVVAARLRLGDDLTPLSTYDQESETLSVGDFNQNIEKVRTEKELVKKLLPELTPKPEVPVKKTPSQHYEQLINLIEQ